jgi:hypothetical protein
MDETELSLSTIGTQAAGKADSKVEIIPPVASVDELCFDPV